MGHLKLKYKIEYIIPGLIFVVLFLLPVLFTRVNGSISWHHVFKIWKDQALLIPLFLLNHFLFVPKMLFNKRYFTYFFSVLALIFIFTVSYYYYDEVLNEKPQNRRRIEANKPEKIPPYAHLMMYSILVVGVDSGLMFSKRWQINEEKKQHLEKENIRMQLEILRNQVSPHFFMNTLNNIYAMVDIDTQMAKESIMKLSKLMRYLLYENESGRVKISKEFEFINSYIDLMKLRSDENVSIQLIFPEKYTDVTIPALLFISYIENAFKYGLSYQKTSFINIVFEISEDKLHFTCINTRNAVHDQQQNGGIGLQNSESRLRILFDNNYKLNINATEKLYNVSLNIPLT